ncbi:uncharacterized protein [Zea mays]|nr:uncharacterized protein LOC103627207 [Zea mays]|eukprot:XP_008645727.1 uncharacterized protein LOC103627207 [Zea mays]
MASGSGRARGGGIRIQEPGSRHRDESNAGAAAAAAEPPPPSPSTDGLQERPHGPLGAESGSPSAAAAALKGKGVLAPSPLPSPTRSEETNSLVSSDIVSDEEAEELRSANTLADGDRRFGVSWKSPLVEAMMEVPKVTRHIDSKTAFDNLSMEQQWALAEEIEMQQRQQAQQRKCLWITFKGGMSNMFLDWIGRQMHNFNSDSTVIIPHVNHQTIPMTGIIEHYNLMETDAGRGVIFHSNVLNLRRAYSEFRPVHGDGDCFYRSFMFSYLEQVLDRQDTHEEHRLLAAVEGVARHHAHLEWNSEFSLRHKAFKTLIKKVMRWKRHNRWKNVLTTDSYSKQKLLKFFSGCGRPDNIFAFLRLVAAIWIYSHSEEFEPLIPELDEYDTLREWCSQEVIRHKVFTDHVQMTALVTALGVPLRVEYLLQVGDGQDLYDRQEDSQDYTPTSTCWSSHRRQLPHVHVVPRVTVLYTNAHYDIIYPHRRDGPPVPSIDERCCQQTALVQRPTTESSGQQIAQRDSCSGTGESSSQHIAQVEISTDENSDQHAELKLTSTDAHEYDDHC